MVSNNLFNGNVNAAFSNLDNSAVFADAEFTNEGSGDIYGYQLASTSPVIDAGTEFPEPLFPMAGQGIFANISLNTATDMYGNAVDISNLLPNIGADNSFNSGKVPSFYDNFDFEDVLNHWNTWNNPVNSNQNDAHAVNSAVQFFDKGSVNKRVTVKPNTYYIFSAYLKTNYTTNRVVLGVRDTNYTSVLGTSDCCDANYTRHEVAFNSGNRTSVKISIWQSPSNGAFAWGDDVMLVKDLIYVFPTVMQKEPLNSKTGLMNTDLNTAGLTGLLATSATSQPYSVVPWN